VKVLGSSARLRGKSRSWSGIAAGNVGLVGVVDAGGFAAISAD